MGTGLVDQICILRQMLKRIGSSAEMRNGMLAGKAGPEEEGEDTSSPPWL